MQFLFTNISGLKPGDNHFEINDSCLSFILSCSYCDNPGNKLRPLPCTIPNHPVEGVGVTDQSRSNKCTDLRNFLYLGLRSGMWRRRQWVTGGQRFFLYISAVGRKTNMLSQQVRHRSLTEAIPHPRRTETSTAAVQKPIISISLFNNAKSHRNKPKP
jgi:hypothetical protein